MTAPESSPKPAEAIAQDAAMWIASFGNGWSSMHEDIRKACVDKIIKAAAAIQRGDGQTDYAGKRRTFETDEEIAAVEKMLGKTPPAAKPNETSGATPEDITQGMKFLLSDEVDPAVFELKQEGDRLNRERAAMVKQLENYKRIAKLSHGDLAEENRSLLMEADGLSEKLEAERAEWNKIYRPLYGHNWQDRNKGSSL